MEIDLVILAVKRFLTSVTYKVEGRGNRCITSLPPPIKKIDQAKYKKIDKKKT